MKMLLILLYLLFTAGSFLSQTIDEKIVDLLQRYSDYNLFNGSVLVSENNDIVFEGGFGYANMEYDILNTENTVHRIGSITKQFVAAMIMQLVEEGKISINDNIIQHLSNYRKDTGEKVTIHQLLTHSSGIPNYTALPGFWSDSTRNPYTPGELVEKFCSGDLAFEPGTKFSYSNSGYAILARIIEEVTSESYEKNIQERILNRIGMKSTFLDRPYKIIKNRASGYEKRGIKFRNARYMDPVTAFGAGDIVSSVKDLFLWDQALYGNKIISPESKKKAYTPYISNYGYGWGIEKIKNPSGDDSLTQISHSGGINGFSSNITRIIDDGIAIILLNNTGGAPLGSIRNEILNILYDQNYNYPLKPIGNHLYTLIENNGIETAIDQYYRIKKEEKDVFQFNEGELNSLGYVLLEEGKIDKSIEIFELNINEYPESFNTYDSMGEALMEKGDTLKSIDYYKKSISMNPRNQNGYKMLEKMGVSISPPKDADVPIEILKTYIGKYKLFPNFDIYITEDQGKLYAQATGQDKFQIYPESESIFYYKVVDAKIEFLVGNGKVIKLILFQNNQEIPGLKVE